MYIDLAVAKVRKLAVQQIAVILQHEIKNSKTKIYIASFQMALELGYLKGGYVNFGFAALDLYCKITAICCTWLQSTDQL